MNNRAGHRPALARSIPRVHQQRHRRRARTSPRQARASARYLANGHVDPSFRLEEKEEVAETVDSRGRTLRGRGHQCRRGVRTAEPGRQRRRLARPTRGREAGQRGGPVSTKQVCSIRASAGRGHRPGQGRRGGGRRTGWTPARPGRRRAGRPRRLGDQRKCGKGRAGCPERLARRRDRRRRSPGPELRLGRGLQLARLDRRRRTLPDGGLLLVGDHWGSPLTST